MFSIPQSAVFYIVQKSKGDGLCTIADAEVGVGGKVKVKRMNSTWV